MFDQFKNPNSTYNGVTAMAAWSGLSIEEIQWTADRLKQLMVDQGKSKDEAKTIVKEEAKSKPWIK